jgi:hypothetical protein
MSASVNVAGFGAVPVSTSPVLMSPNQAQAALMASIPARPVVVSLPVTSLIRLESKTFLSPLFPESHSSTVDAMPAAVRTFGFELINRAVQTIIQHTPSAEPEAAELFKSAIQIAVRHFARNTRSEL